MTDEILNALITEVPRDKIDDILTEVVNAEQDGRLKVITVNGRIAGFFTYRYKTLDGVLHLFINNCVVYEPYRSKNTFLSLRGEMRKMCGNIYWKSRKRNRMCFVK